MKSSDNIRLKLCYLTGLVASAAIDELDSSSYNAELDVIDDVSIWHEKELIIFQEVRTLHFKASVNVPLVPASARFLQVATLFHWLTLMSLRFLFNWWQIKWGLFVEFSQNITALLSLHVQTLFTVRITRFPLLDMQERERLAVPI